MAKQKREGSVVPVVEQIATTDLIPYARNSRTHSDEQVAQIAASIREFGFNNPVLIDAENTIIAGHGRVLAAGRMKLETVPCLRLTHLTEAQRRAYVIADNRIALNAAWDQELLSVELADLNSDEFDMGLLGFASDELEKLLSGDSSSDIFEEVSELKINAKTMQEQFEDYDESIIRQIILIYKLAEYDAVIDAMGQYADEHGLTNNTSVVSHLLETNGYAISQRTT
jgi:ParB-like chromosome segregation protein Spo0J